METRAWLGSSYENGVGRWRLRRLNSHQQSGVRRAQFDHIDRRNEAVAALREGLDEPGILCRIPKSLSKTVHRRIQSVIEVYERVGRPQALPKFFPRHDVTATGQQQDENIDRPPAQLDQATVLPQFTSPAVNLEEAKSLRGVARFRIRIHVIRLAGRFEQFEGNCRLST